MHPFHRKSATLPAGLTAGVCLWVGVAGCADVLLSINPQGAEDEICAGLYVTGEDFLLCRRVGDGALGGYDVFLEELAIDGDGNIVFAGNLVIGKAEISQQFRPLDVLDEQDLTLRGVYWELKQHDNRPLVLQNLEQIAEVAAAVDPDSTAAKQFVREFILHYFRNDNTLLAAEKSVVYGFDHFMECADQQAPDRSAVCADLYDLNADGTLSGVDYGTLVDILQGDGAADGVRPVADFTLHQYYSCRDQVFDNGGLVITPECHNLDRTRDDQVSTADLPLLFDVGPTAPLDQTPPVASAGEDRALSFDAGGGTVFLGGFKSYDLETDRANLRFQWRQVDGILPVTLQEADRELAFFQVPAGLITGDFQFELTVTDDDAQHPLSDSDRVAISVAIAQEEEGGTTPDDPADPATDDAPTDVDPGSSFSSAARLQLGEDGQASRDQTLAEPDGVHVYDLGPVSMGDRVTVHCRAAADSILDPMIALFDSNTARIGWNDDTATFDLNATLSLLVSHDTDPCYLGVASSMLNPTAGDYELTVNLEPQVGLAPLTGQTIILHWDAAGSVTIAGQNFGDLAAFDAATVAPEFADRTAELQSGVLAAVRADYAPYNVSVLTTDDAPPSNTTTVFFGAQDEFGIFGLADGIDFYNANRTDNAFIDLGAFAGLTADTDALALAVANVVSHEIGHLLGLMHTRDGTEIMDTTGEDSTLLSDQTFGVAAIFDFPIGQQNAPLLLTDTVGQAAKGALPALAGGPRRCGTCGMVLGWAAAAAK